MIMGGREMVEEEPQLGITVRRVRDNPGETLEWFSELPNRS